MSEEQPSEGGAEDQEKQFLRGGREAGVCCTRATVHVAGGQPYSRRAQRVPTTVQLPQKRKQP